MDKTITGSRQQLENRGFEFNWANSAYVVCVHYHGVWIGTYDAHHTRGFAIPHEARVDMLAAVKR